MEGIPQRVPMGGTVRGYAATLAEERKRAMEALERMKALERKHQKKLRAVRIDERTVVYAKGERLKELRECYEEVPPHRGGRRKRSL